MSVSGTTATRNPCYSLRETPASYDDPFSFHSFRGTGYQATGYCGEVRAIPWMPSR